MKKLRVKLFCITLAIAVLMMQFFAVPMTVLADDPTSPPTEMPETFIRNLDGNLDYSGNFFGSACLTTKKTFSAFNLNKYDYIEFDIFLDCSGSETAVRFYFLDDTYANANVGRGFYDFYVSDCKWTHVKVLPTQFNCGYGMNGNTGRMVGTMFESKQDTAEQRIVVANMCLTANHVVSPDTMPDRLLTNVGVDVNLTAKEDQQADAGIVSITQTDFTYGDYVELDYYVESNENADSSAIALYDADGKKSVYTFNATCNGWNHLKIADTAFKGDADLTEIVKYGCDKYTVGNVYHFANVCITGVAIPGTYPENTAEKISAVLDYTGTKSVESVTPFGSTVDMTGHDFFEFDLYLETADSFDQPYIFIYDSGYSGTGSPLAANRRQNKLSGIEKNKWNHVKISTFALMAGAGKGDIGKAAGIYISNLTANTRYIIADLCLTDVTAPEKSNVFTEIKSAAGTVKYRGSDYKATQAVLNEDRSAYDITKNDYLECDFYIVSENESETVTFGLADETYNGTNGVSTVKKSVKTNEWSHLLLSISDFKGSADLSKAVSFGIVSPVNTAKYFVNNISATDVEAPEMNNTFTLKKELGVEWDYSGKSAFETVKRFDTVNFKDYSYVEFDVCILSNSAERTLRMYFVDETFNNGNSGRGYDDLTVASNGWQHVIIPLSVFNTGYNMNGNRSRVNGFHFDKLVSGERLIVKNVCLTNLDMPELNTKHKLMKETDVEINYAGIDPYATKASIASTDMMQYDFTEFDVFVYGTDNYIRLMFLDSTFAKKGTGCGFYDFYVSPGQWNHIVVSNTAFNTGYGMGGNKNDVCGYQLDNLSAGNQYVVTNLCYTDVDVPEINNKYELKKNLEGSNWCFSGISVASQTKLPIDMVDATQYQYVEFDAYVDSESDSARFRLFFYDSSYMGKNAGRGFKDFDLATNQWHHIIVDLQSFNTGYEMNGKLSELSGFMLDQISASNGYYFFNLCFTSRKQSVPYDEGDRPAKPDQDARYISCCDTPIDEVGSWNSSATYFTADYKTEGTKSIVLKVDNQLENVNNFKFGFDQPIDFSKTESIRFDLMIDDIKLARKTTASVVLSSSRRATTDNHFYELDFSQLKEGWNSLELPISAFAGEADLSSVNCFAIIMHSSLASDDFYVLCLDNLRASKTFTIVEKSADTEDTDDDSDDDYDYEDDYGYDDDDDYYYDDLGYEDVDEDDSFSDDDVDEKGNNQKKNGTVTKKIIRRYLNKNNDGMSIDLIILICSLAGCGLLVLAVLILLLLTKRQLDRLSKNQS